MIDQRIFEHDRNFNGSKGLVFIGDKMVVYRRDTQTTDYPLYIDLPGGGMEPGESPFSTFAREVMEEFGVTVTEKDVTYAKLYPSVVDPTKESYFIVVELKGITVDQIRFGDEGLEYFLLTPEEYLALPDAIEFHISRIKEYLESPR